ncbi:MAG: hypothetical protein JWN73_1960 [Betaproteobacteria bacterium]|nr:hypothetical protein [Betaproteobacteria bacterium]
MPGTKLAGGTGISFQTKSLKWNLDDLLVNVGSSLQGQGRFAISCKSNSQVTRNGLPRDFVASAWADRARQDITLDASKDQLMLVTRGRHPEFQATWSDIKAWCESEIPLQAISNIEGSRKHQKVFRSVAPPADQAQPSEADLVAMVRFIQVIPLDFDVEPSEARAEAIAASRELLRNGTVNDATETWNELVSIAHEQRVKAGTIGVETIWSRLKEKFTLLDQPNFAGDFRILRALSQDNAVAIETTLGGRFSLLRRPERTRLNVLFQEHDLTIVFGDSGTGKSALTSLALRADFLDGRVIWLSAEDFEKAVSEGDRQTLGLRNPLADTLKAVGRNGNTLVIDFAERLTAAGIAKLTTLINQICQSSQWKCVVIMQPDGLEGRPHRGLTAEIKVVAFEVQTLPNADIRAALKSTKSLEWLATQDDTFESLRNIKSLSWLILAEDAFDQSDGNSFKSRTAVADRIWIFWTQKKPSYARLLMQLGAQFADQFKSSLPISGLGAAETAILDDAPSALPVRVNAKHQVEFEHDLAAEWSRFQHLKQIADQIDTWSPLAANPVWAGAVRTLGQYFLRETVEGGTRWDKVFSALSGGSKKNEAAADLLLDALFFDPQSFRYLDERIELLLSSNGRLLNRLLRRFRHVATSASISLPQIASEFGIYLESMYRSPIFSRWGGMLRFLEVNRIRVAKLVAPEVSELCLIWLNATGGASYLGDGLPYRLEMARLALDIGRQLQIEIGKHRYRPDEDDKTIITAALAASEVIPDEAAAWSLEMVNRRPWHEDVMAEINAHHQRLAEEHQRRLRDDPVFRKRIEERRYSPMIGSNREKLPPWHLGPYGSVDRKFAEACESAALYPLMRIRPKAALEVLLATLVEGSPEEPGRHLSLDDYIGLEWHDSTYPTSYWKSAFFGFLGINPNIALRGLIDLVNFCTDRWGKAAFREMGRIPGIVIDGLPNVYYGGRSTLNWVHENSNHVGQLYCGLAALERQLCAWSDVNVEIAPYIATILSRSRSLALIGVLLNVGKYKPALFSGPLLPLLGHAKLYFYDDSRVTEALPFAFDALNWSAQGDFAFNAARDWINAPYRHRRLREVASDLAASDAKVADFLRACISDWPRTDSEGAALEIDMLGAELDSRNLQIEVAADGTSTITRVRYPLEIVQRYQAKKNATAREEHLLQVPFQCCEVLRKSARLSNESVKYLAQLLKDQFDGVILEDHFKATLRVVSAGTLVCVYDDSHNEVAPALREARQILDEQVAAIAAIGDSTGLSKEERSPFSDRIEVITHAIYKLWRSSSIGAERDKYEKAILVLISSGFDSALNMIFWKAHQEREELHNNWWRLLELGYLWVGLTALTRPPYSGLPKRSVWSHWRRQFRAFKIDCIQPNLQRVSLHRIAAAVERLESRAWSRAKTKDPDEFKFRGDRSRHFHGFNSDVLEAVFNWLIDKDHIADDLIESGKPGWNALFFLDSLRAYFNQVERRDDEEDARTTSKFGYSLQWASALYVLRYPVAKARTIWEPIFDLGPKGHYAIGAFIDQWHLIKISDSNAASFEQHWRAMIEHTLNETRWHTGKGWYDWEQTIRRLIGISGRTAQPETELRQNMIWALRDAYQRWAQERLQRDDTNLHHFCAFLAAKLADKLRPLAISWVRTGIEKHDLTKYWKPKKAGAALLECIATLLSQIERGEASMDDKLRADVLWLCTLLVSKEVPSAIVLQQRVQRYLMGAKPAQ